MLKVTPMHQIQGYYEKANALDIEPNGIFWLDRADAVDERPLPNIETETTSAHSRSVGP